MQSDDTNNANGIDNGGHVPMDQHAPMAATDDRMVVSESDTLVKESAPIVDPSPAVPVKPKKDWIGSLLVLVSVGFGLWAAIAAYGAGWNAWSRDAAVAQLYMAAIASATVAIIAILFIWGARKQGWRQSYAKRFLALMVSLGLVGYLGSWWLPSITKPALHDISTSLADPPVFRTTLLRDDNWDRIPEADNSAYQGLSPRQRWEQIHREAYPDLRTVRVDQSATLLMEKAERLANARGWEIKDLDAADGRMEAHTTSTPMAYPHDIVLRIRPAEGNTGSIIDMRSVSQEGYHDLGSNAEIIRSFLADLSGTTSGQ